MHLSTQRVWSNRPMDPEKERLAAFRAELIESLGRLKAAGLIVDFGFGPDDHLWIEHTEAGRATADALAAERRRRPSGRDAP
jgi:hypothetical protein